MFYGKGLISKKSYDAVYQACDFPKPAGGKLSVKCDAAVELAEVEIGPHNVYDIYDNCNQTDAWLQRTGKSMRPRRAPAAPRCRPKRRSVPMRRQ